ncbi:hypothetical protein SAMN04487968_102115 [Nocardioides terrae]|uniref:Uncharacterized protein n=1 Tax=Nocardioides terrae TaxID=574651 RepID=A0A1I1EPP5_9ACTN|nr:hypothetical protein [Nocardioides terrae]SFB87488.1 hypothetical protein SAMN04487968_102115 [Nocardioides terrae]
MTTLALTLTLGLLGWCICSVVVGLVVGRIFAAGDRHLEASPERELPELDIPVQTSRAVW